MGLTLVGPFNRKMFKYLLVLFSFCCMSVDGHPELCKIPIDDYRVLEKFFDYLIHYTTIGYTLCGEKPVAIETLPSLAKIPPNYSVKILAEYEGYSILWKGLETWNQYSDRFPSEEFAFIFVEDFNTIVFLNKKNTIDIVEQNLELFQKKLGAKFTSNDILLHICDDSRKQYIITSDQILLGILLGYGTNNSRAFSNKC